MRLLSEMDTMLLLSFFVERCDEELIDRSRWRIDLQAAFIRSSDACWTARIVPRHALPRRLVRVHFPTPGA
jgi:hypothetical protein